MSLPPYLVIDTETTIKNKGPGAVGKSRPSPFSPHNRIVAIGLLSNAAVTTGSQYLQGYVAKDGTGNYTKGAFTTPFVNKVKQLNYPLVIGHNIKFDLHFLRMENPDKFAEISPRLTIWDTQHVEYLLTGQLHQWARLNDLILKYGGTPKPDKIKTYWDGNIDTEDIPKDELLEYLENDVRMTEMVFLAQYEQAQTIPNMMNLIESQMDFLLSLEEMEFNGMHINQELIKEKIVELTALIKERESELTSFMAAELKLSEVNYGSTQQLSILLFGGKLVDSVKTQEVTPSGLPRVWLSGLKKGQPRFKTSTIEITYPGLCPTLALARWKGKTGFYSTGEKILSELAKSPTIKNNQKLEMFLKTILEIRGMNKDLTTYYQGYLDLTWQDGKIHHNLNNCATNTGRLSSSAPNLQNVTHGEK